MAVAYRSSSAVAVGTTALSISMPSGTVANDIMIMVVTQHSTNLGFTIADTEWAPFVGQASTNGYGFMAWKRAGVSESGPYSITGLVDSCCGAIMSFSGCRLVGNPVEQYTARANSSGYNGTSGITTTEDGCMIISAACVMDNLALSSWTATNPATLSERFDGRTTLGSDTGVGAATAIRSTAGATGSTAYTIASAFENVGLCCSLLPAVDISLTTASSDHAHDATVADPMDIGLVLTDSCSHAHSVDNVALDVMLDVDDCTHAHSADATTLTHNLVISLYTHLFFWLIATPAVGGVPGPKIPHGCTITEISSYVTGSGKTVTFNVEERTDQDAAGTNVLASDQVADDNGTSATSFDNKYLAKDNFLWIDISAVDADAGMVAITISASDEMGLEVNISNHGHYADNVELTQAHTLEVQSSTHAHTADEITSNTGLVVDNSTHAHDVDNVVTTEDWGLPGLANCTHAHSVENIALDVDLIVSDCTHAHTVDGITVSMNEGDVFGYTVTGFYTWTINNPVVGVVPGPKIFKDVDIVEVSSYVTAETSVAFNVESRGDHALSGDNVLASDQVADVSGESATSFANVHISQGRFLCLDISAVSGTPGVVTITVAWEYLSGGVDNCTHAHTADNVVLVANEDILLVIQDSSHAHLADVVSMTQLLRRSVAVELIVTPVSLVVSDCTHAHTADNVVVSGGTRIYLPSSGSSSINPGVPSYWDEGDHDILQAKLIKGTTALANKTSTTQNFVPTTVLNRMYILGEGTGLVAHHYTSSETFGLVVRCLESSQDANCSLAFSINAFDITGVTHYGSVYSGSVNLSEFNSSQLQGRYCSGVAFTGDVDAPGEHVLAFGFGSYANNVTGEEYTVTLNFGDSPSSALDMSNSDTDSDYPYIDFPSILLGNYSTPLAVSNCNHVHNADNVGLSVTLVVDNSDHAHTSDNIDLTGINSVLIVQNSSHSLISSNVNMLQEGPHGVSRHIWYKQKGKWIMIS